MKSYTFYIIVIILWCFSSGAAQGPFAAHVEVSVKTSDKTVAAEVKQAVAEQLQQIPDVVVSGEGRADYMVQLFIDKADDSNTNDPYYSMMWVIGKQADCSYPHTFKDGFPVKEPCMAALAYDSISRVTRKGLRMKIRELAMVFDTEVLKNDRKHSYRPN